MWERKEYLHGREEQQCRECNPCPHGKVKNHCAACNP